MNATDERERTLAVFFDFENIAEGVRQARFKELDISLVIQRLLEKGKILVKRAYADWSRYKEHKRALHEAAIDMIEIPQRRLAGKNSADIRMVVDAMELCYSKPHVDTFALVSGDSDLSPLVSKLRESNKYVIGMGVKGSTSSLLVANCDEFVFYQDLVRSRQGGVKVRGLTKRQTEAFGILVDAVKALNRENREILYSSLMKDTIRRKNPSFDESYFGYDTFSQLLEDAARHSVIKIEKSLKSGTYVVTALGSGTVSDEPSRSS